MRCEEIMKRRLHTIPPELPVNDAARLMKTEQIGFLPICNAQGYALGGLSERDIVLRLCAEDLPGKTTSVGQIMTPCPVHCHASDSLDHAEKLMLKHETERILIVDDDGKLTGLITMAEIAQHEAPYTTARWVRELSAKRFRFEH